MVWTLLPVPLGETEPAVQMLQLFNMGAEDVEYWIGHATGDEEGREGAFAGLARANYGFPVVRCGRGAEEKGSRTRILAFTRTPIPKSIWPQ